MAKKKHDDAEDDATEPAAIDLGPELAPAPPADAVRTAHDPLTVIGIDHDGHVVYVNDPKELEAAGAFDRVEDAAGVVQTSHARKILYQGGNFEASAIDADGCWIYRQM